MAKVTVGMPLYNNAETLEKSLESVLAQTEKEVEVILSDDGSTDETWEICKRYSSTNINIKAYRQKSNLYYQNFEFVLREAKTQYFVWLAGDDWWDDTYLEKCIEILDHHPEYVCCVSRCNFYSDGIKLHEANGTFELRGNYFDNLKSYLQSPRDNSRMYGVYRREALCSSFPKKIFHAYDWALVASTLRFGGYYEIDETLLKRDKTDDEAYTTMPFRDSKNFIAQIFPLLSMSTYLIRHREISLRPKALYWLFRLNLRKHEWFISWNYPKFRESFHLIYDRIK